MCSEDKKNGQNPDCPYNCLLVNNGIMRNKVINRTAVEWTLSKFGLGNPGWIPVIHDGLDKCPLEHDANVTLKETFKKFEDCINVYFREHCIDFSEQVECDEVEEFMMKCQSISYNCTVWPRWIVKLPETCCNNRPELFKKELKDKAEEFCKTQDIMSNLGTMQCLATYLIKTSGMKSEDGKWDFSVAKKMLTDNCGGDSKWKAAIEKTVETCEEQVHGLARTFQYFFQSFN